MYETIHYTDLPPANSDQPFYREWNTYLREIGRLLREGHEGRFVLIKAEAIVSLFATEEAAREAGLRLFLLEPFLVQQVREREPLLRVRGMNMPCRLSISPLAKPA